MHSRCSKQWLERPSPSVTLAPCPAAVVPHSPGVFVTRCSSRVTHFLFSGRGFCGIEKVTGVFADGRTVAKILEGALEAGYEYDVTSVDVTAISLASDPDGSEESPRLCVVVLLPVVTLRFFFPWRSPYCSLIAPTFTSFPIYEVEDSAIFDEFLEEEKPACGVNTEVVQVSWRVVRV